MIGPEFFFATSASTLFGTVDLCSTQNQVGHPTPLRNGPELRFKFSPTVGVIGRFTFIDFFRGQASPQRTSRQDQS